MTQIYAIVHDGAGNFLIAKKNVLGYFFHDPGGGGTIVPKGQKLNGAGDWAFPGGALQGDGVDQTARNEFKEECALEVPTDERKPDRYSGSDGKWTYYGVYFDVGGKLDTLNADVNEHLKIGTKAAGAVMAGKYRKEQYTELMRTFPGSPVDNELASTEVWNLVEKWTEIASWKDDRKKGWYYCILDNLRTVLKLPPP
jgi:ADP-ribose pyrophosphatase YjhB (NUDIX family)